MVYITAQKMCYILNIKKENLGRNTNSYNNIIDHIDHIDNIQLIRDSDILFFRFNLILLKLN